MNDSGKCKSEGSIIKGMYDCITFRSKDIQVNKPEQFRTEKF
jgi:hypothetical protein